MRVRLQKFLADKGVASRRACEEFIVKGLITVNGTVVTKLGTTVDPASDRVEIAPSLKTRKESLVYFALNKPTGYVCSVTGPERPKVMELVKDIPQRIFPVGRLDKMTSGLLLMTNDGQFAYRLTHPKFEKEKEYTVKLREQLNAEILTKLREQFYIRGKRTATVSIMQKSTHRFHIILKEGRNRQIRRMCQRAGVHVLKLKRVRIGELTLGDIPLGSYRALTGKEVLLLTPKPS